MFSFFPWFVGVSLTNNHLSTNLCAQKPPPSLQPAMSQRGAQVGLLSQFLLCNQRILPPVYLVDAQFHHRTIKATVRLRDFTPKLALI